MPNSVPAASPPTVARKPFSLISRPQPSTIIRSRSRHNKSGRSKTIEKPSPVLAKSLPEKEEELVEEESNEADTRSEDKSFEEVKESASSELALVSYPYKLDSSLPVPASLQQFLEKDEGSEPEEPEEVPIPLKDFVGTTSPEESDDIKCTAEVDENPSDLLAESIDFPLDSQSTCLVPFQHQQSEQPHPTIPRPQSFQQHDPNFFWRPMGVSNPPNMNGPLPPHPFFPAPPDFQSGAWDRPIHRHPQSHPNTFPVERELSDESRGGFPTSIADPSAMKLSPMQLMAGLATEPDNPASTLGQLSSTMSLVRSLADKLPQMQYMAIEHEKLLQEIDVLREYRHQTTFQIQKKDEDIEHASARFSTAKVALEKELTKTRMETAGLSEKCTDLQDQVTQLTDENQQLKDDLYKAKAEYDGKVAHLNEQLRVIDLNAKEKSNRSFEKKNKWFETETRRMETAFEEYRKTEREGHIKQIQALRNKFDEDCRKFQLERDKDRDHFETEKQSLNDMLANQQTFAKGLSAEIAALQETIRRSSDVIDIKSRGDSYYLDAFQRLNQQIIEVAASEFGSVPADINVDEKDPIISRLPDFTATTPSATDVRIAYVKHVVSSIVCKRIFQPFLFSLGRSHGWTDQFLNNVGHEMRQKSHKREATWRQNFLIVTYTAPDAKRTANTAAANAVDEIASRLRFLIVPEREESITKALRNIVKLAAETWRYARLEKEVFAAQMAVDYTSVADPNIRSQLAGPSGPADLGKCPEQFTLPLLPRITRSSSPLLPNDSQNSGFIYLEGDMLSPDAPCLIQRQREILEQSNAPRLPGVGFLANSPPLPHNAANIGVPPINADIGPMPGGFERNPTPEGVPADDIQHMIPQNQQNSGFRSPPIDDPDGRTMSRNSVRSPPFFSLAPGQISPVQSRDPRGGLGPSKYQPKVSNEAEEERAKPATPGNGGW